MTKEIKLEIDLEKFRYSLIGNGYNFEDVEKMTEEGLVSVLEMKVCYYIEKEYQRSKKLGLIKT